MTALRLDLHFEDLRLARIASPSLPCFVLVLFVSLALYAAGAMPSAARAEEKSSSSLIKQRIKAVTARLEQARIRLNQLSTAAEDVPPEATESEREEYYRLSNLLVSAYENHLDTVKRLLHAGDWVKSDIRLRIEELFNENGSPSPSRNATYILTVQRLSRWNLPRRRQRRSVEPMI
ncbi:MAG: hypothetical protein ACU826_01460 [Gammaproteobacteria bacterium]